MERRCGGENRRAPWGVPRDEGPVTGPRSLVGKAPVGGGDGPNGAAGRRGLEVRPLGRAGRRRERVEPTRIAATYRAASRQPLASDRLEGLEARMQRADDASQREIRPGGSHQSEARFVSRRTRGAQECAQRGVIGTGGSRLRDGSAKFLLNRGVVSPCGCTVCGSGPSAPTEILSRPLTGRAGSLSSLTSTRRQALQRAPHRAPRDPRPARASSPGALRVEA